MILLLLIIRLKEMDLHDILEAGKKNMLETRMVIN